MRGLVLALLVACYHTNAGPKVVLKFAGTWPDADRQSTSDGANAWVRLGYIETQTDDPSLPECPPFWYRTKTTNCKLTVVLQKIVNLSGEFNGTVDGMADQGSRSIFIDSKWNGWAMVAIMAHEFGHILLDTPKHLVKGQIGIMVPAGDSWIPTQADYDLACSTIGICYKITN